MRRLRSRAYFLPLAFLSVIPASALAGGVNFSWDDCIGDGGRHNRNFACVASTGTETAIGSFILSSPMPDFRSVEIVINLNVAGAFALPNWWTFSPEPGNCRGSALAISFDFSSLANHSCAVPFGGPVVGGLMNYSGRSSEYDQGRIIGLGAMDPSDAAPLEAGIEYYAFRLVLNKDRATGPDSCAGCSVPVDLWIGSVRAVGVAEGSSEDCTTPSTQSCIGWQGGACYFRDPVMNTTWGRVKGLYR
jgi:hypothetical protein